MRSHAYNQGSKCEEGKTDIQYTHTTNKGEVEEGRKGRDRNFYHLKDEIRLKMIKQTNCVLWNPMSSSFVRF